MLTADHSFELAQHRALQTDPVGDRAKLEVEISEPPGFYFVPEYAGESCDDSTLVGDGGFFVSRVTGEIQHFGSGEFVPASAAVGRETGRRDLAAIVE